MNQVDKTDQEIGDDDSENTRQSTLSSGIEEDNVDHLQEVLHLGLMRSEKSLCTTMVPLPEKWSHADTVIAHPLIPIFKSDPS